VAGALQSPDLISWFWGGEGRKGTKNNRKEKWETGRGMRREVGREDEG